MKTVNDQLELLAILSKKYVDLLAGETPKLRISGKILFKKKFVQHETHEPQAQEEATITSTAIPNNLQNGLCQKFYSKRFFNDQLKGNMDDGEEKFEKGDENLT